MVIASICLREKVLVLFYHFSPGPGLFSLSPDLGGGGGAQRPRWHESLWPQSIPDAKFEAGSSSGFGDMTSQNFPRKKGTSHQIRLFTPGKRI